MKQINIDSILNELKTDVQEALEKTGKYSKGWGQTKQKDSIIIHNKKRASLTHLLEKGHAKRNGGRVAPIKHIEPVEEFIKKEMVNRIEKELG